MPNFVPDFILIIIIISFGFYALSQVRYAKNFFERFYASIISISCLITWTGILFIKLFNILT